ncbi:MAG: hypothetical protein Q8P18_32410 [Pseudomonadota bacterium]|nr:hypothetical protein [Pseudomonadota bacterium]
MVLLLITLALAADPPPTAPAAPPVPPVVAAPRPCAEGQLCDGRCISWAEACPSAVEASVVEMLRADRDAAMGAVVCAARPEAPAPLPPSVVTTIMLHALAGVACGASADQRCVYGIGAEPPGVAVAAPGCGRPQAPR